MSEHWIKSHNKTLLLYHFVFPIKYRRSVINGEVGQTLKEICSDITERYEINFVEIGHESNHVHFLIQSVPTLCVTDLVRIIKSIVAKQIFSRHPEIKAKLWGGNFWTSGYYANTVGQYGNEDVIKRYVQNQGKEKEYKELFKGQLELF